MVTPDRSPVVCRDAGVDDLPAAARLAAEHHGGEAGTWVGRLHRSLQRQDAHLIVAEVDGRLVGYGKAGRCAPVDDDDPAPAGRYLTGLVVDPAWRRRGIGEELTLRRLGRIHADGETAWCFANARNAASIALHVGLGLVEVGRAPRYLGEPFTGGVGVLLRADPPTGPGWRDRMITPGRGLSG